MSLLITALRDSTITVSISCCPTNKTCGLLCYMCNSGYYYIQVQRFKHHVSYLKASFYTLLLCTGDISILAIHWAFPVAENYLY